MHGKQVQRVATFCKKKSIDIKHIEVRRMISGIGALNLNNINTTCNIMRSMV